MIVSFAHKGLEQFFRNGSKAGIRPEHAVRLARQLVQLNTAASPEEMRSPGWDLHRLAGTLAGHWSVKVSANWRLTFRFVGTNAEHVDYVDYH